MKSQNFQAKSFCSSYSMTWNIKRTAHLLSWTHFRRTDTMKHHFWCQNY